VTLSRHPESSSGPSPSCFWHVLIGRLRPEFPDVPFTRRTRPQVSPTAVHFELGPRSLDPAAVFAARMPSLFETRRRLTTSATAFTTCGQPNHCGPRFLAGTVASTTFLFLRTTPLIAEQWHAASRATSASADPGAGSAWLPRFAQPRYLRERPTTAELPRWCIVRINEHGSKDRVKDASRSACNGVPCVRPVPTLMVA